MRLKERFDVMRVLDSIPAELELDSVMTRLHHVKMMEPCVRELLEIARPIARPKAIYAACQVGEKGDDWVSVDGVTFNSRVLRVNLDSADKVFPYVITCGTELDEIPTPPDDLLRSYCLEAIKLVALGCARSYLENHLKDNHGLESMSRMGPGSLEDWPITQQGKLFSIFGDVEDLIGVRLGRSFQMVPIKSGSGIIFPSRVKFESCQLCPREECEGRRAPYDAELLRSYGGDTPVQSCSRTASG